MTEYKLPIEVTSEKAVLGAILIDPDVYYDVAEKISASDFYNNFHQSVFDAISKIVSNQNPIDIISIEQELKANGDKRLNFDNCLGELGDLAQSTGSSKNVLSYVEIVKKSSLRRRVFDVAMELQVDSRKLDTDITTTLDVANGKLMGLLDDDTPDDNMVDATESISRATDLLEQYSDRANSNRLLGVPTGYPDLDELTQGMNPKDLVIIAARPSMGKTTFLLNIFESAIREPKGANVMFSLEMPTDQVTLRMMCSIGSVDFQKARKGELSDSDWNRFAFAAKEVKDRDNLYIDDTPGISPLYIRSKCRQLKRKHGSISMIGIDYLQLMSWAKYAGPDNRTNEISFISRELKSIAKEMGCPVIALSQLNRSLEQRPDKRPINSDLRESGAIEQDADLIMFIYRDEIYNEGSLERGLAEIIIGKQRNGPLGTVKVGCKLNMCRFEPI